MIRTLCMRDVQRLVVVVQAATLISTVAAACSSEQSAPMSSTPVASGAQADGSVPDLPAASLSLGFGSYGDIQLGMSENDVVGRGYTLGAKVSADGCDGYELSHDPKGGELALFFKPTSGRLSKIQVDRGTAALPEQQPTVEQVKAAYPTATTQVLPPRGPQGARLAVQERSGGPYIVYLSVDGTVARPTTVASLGAGCPAA